MENIQEDVILNQFPQLEQPLLDEILRHATIRQVEEGDEVLRAASHILGGGSTASTNSNKGTAGHGCLNCRGWRFIRNEHVLHQKAVVTQPAVQSRFAIRGLGLYLYHTRVRRSVCLPCFGRVDSYIKTPGFIPVCFFR